MAECIAGTLASEIVLRDIIDADLPIFFEYQLDSDANYMAAFTAKNPKDKNAFNAHWEKIINDNAIIIKTIIYNNNVAGHLASFVESGNQEITYWIGKQYWGKGIATKALTLFLKNVNNHRPLHARVAKDNHASIRVLEKCDFKITGEEKGFANARSEEIAELVLVLI